MTYQTSAIGQTAAPATDTAQSGTTTKSPAPVQSIGSKVDYNAGSTVARLGLALTVGWIGILKFTPAEADAISPFVQNNPIFAFASDLLGKQQFSNSLGVMEITIAALLLSRNSKLSLVGSFLAVGMFFSTISFLFTTPGIFTSPVLGFIPALSVPGQFLLKDVVLLGVAIEVAIKSWKSIRNS